jgi:hypothetical protein
MDASAGLIIAAVLAGLLCLRRRRCPEPEVPQPEVTEEEMQTYCRLSAESQIWSETP